MLKRIVVVFLSLVLLLVLLSAAEEEPVLLLIPLIALLVVLLRKKRRTGKTTEPQKRRAKPMANPLHAEPPARNAAPASSSASHEQTLRIKLAGTAAVKQRQVYLQKIDEVEPPFDACLYDIQQIEYKGEPAFQVCAFCDDGRPDRVLGMVPAAQVQQVQAIYPRITHVDVEVYGGPRCDGEERFYGASATLTYE